MIPLYLYKIKEDVSRICEKKEQENVVGWLVFFGFFLYNFLN